MSTDSLKKIQSFDFIELWELIYWPLLLNSNLDRRGYAYEFEVALTGNETDFNYKLKLKNTLQFQFHVYGFVPTTKYISSCPRH